MATWIWKFGEFETWHNRLLHDRRVEYGHHEPCMWKIYSNDPLIRFTRPLNGESGAISVKVHGDYYVAVVTNKGKRIVLGEKENLVIPDGCVSIEVRINNNESFPCFYMDGAVSSDASWFCDDIACEPEPVGTYSRFDSADKSPIVFPYAYEPVAYTAREKVEDGIVFVYPRETFARTMFTFSKDGHYVVRFGESREEVMDPEWCCIRGEYDTVERSLSFEARAFRYIYVSTADVDVTADYEYQPLEYKGSFECDEPLINRIWQMCAYTFHLNTREFFLDGIKRDRWCWSGDAYQSLFVNHALFMDEETEQRTLIALAGKLPVASHLNTIMDYTFLWFLSLYENYKAFGNLNFVRQIYPQAEALMEFCLKRVDEDGFVRGKPRDWVFIDWADLDKTGALCGEQILFAAALEKFAYISELVGKKHTELAAQAAELQKNIRLKFYDSEKHAYIDSFESGRRFVTRHSNLLAYLYLHLTDDEKQEIYENVILNDSVPQITTPYFKFFENTVHCEAGNISLLESSLRNYYGAMLATGATTIYEQFDPTLKGVEHYAMYGHKYQKSLCHAWSTSPIYLLARYRAGVKNTGIAYNTFEVRPCLGDLKSFNCTVPISHGSVNVSLSSEELKVKTDSEGGTLIWKDQKITLIPGKEISLPA